MQTSEISFMKWQRQFSMNKKCRNILYTQRWANGFECDYCGHDHCSYISTRDLFQCLSCRYQILITNGTIFHSTMLDLWQWFWAIYFVFIDKGGKSTAGLSKEICVSWRTAYTILRKIHATISDQDSLYQLKNWIEFDDAMIGGKKSGKRDRGTEGKTPILVAMKSKGHQTGFIKMKAVDNMKKEVVNTFAASHFQPNQTVVSDAVRCIY